MSNKNEEGNGGGQPKSPFGDMVIPSRGLQDADAEQVEQVRKMLLEQAEMPGIQLLVMRAQIVHMLVTSLRVFSRVEDVPDDEKASLIAKLIIAIDQQLGVLPSQIEDKPKPGMGFKGA